jgi:hypothetical protein
MARTSFRWFQLCYLLRLTMHNPRIDISSHWRSFRAVIAGHRGKDIKEYKSSVLFGIGSFTKTLVDAYCKQVLAGSKKRPSKSPRATPSTGSSRSKNRRPESVDASTVGNGDNAFVEDPSQKTANIQLFRKNKLAMQSSHCIPETPLREAIADTTETPSVSEAGPSTQNQSGHTSVDYGRQSSADAPSVTNSDERQELEAKAEYDGESSSVTDIMPTCGNKLCTDLCNHCVTMEMLMKVRAGEIPVAMASHIISSLHKPSSSSRQAAPAGATSTDRTRLESVSNIRSSPPIDSLRSGKCRSTPIASSSRPAKRTSMPFARTVSSIESSSTVA